MTIRDYALQAIHNNISVTEFLRNMAQLEAFSDVTLLEARGVYMSVQ